MAGGHDSNLDRTPWVVAEVRADRGKGVGDRQPV